MLIKELAYSVQQFFLVRSDTRIKSAHAYEILAASFGFDSYAAFRIDTVFTESPSPDSRSPQEASITRRLNSLGYAANANKDTSAMLIDFLENRHIGTAGIEACVAGLCEEDDVASDPEFDQLMISGLESAAYAGNATAHYALALLAESALDDYDDDTDAAKSHWYEQKRRGRVLEGVEIEWAEAHSSWLDHNNKFAKHLRAAARLGNHSAMLAAAEHFGDTNILDLNPSETNVDHAAVAEIALDMGRSDEALRWWKAAAAKGDTDSMHALLEHEKDPVVCWTWIYVAQALGVDITESDYRAINEDGSDYDDDLGGPIYVSGRDAMEFRALEPTKDALARDAARIFVEGLQDQRI